MTRPERSERYAVVAIVLAALVALALTPLAVLLDEQTDRHRPMYDDIRTMAYLQYLEFQATGHGTAATLDGGDSVVVADHTFTSSQGVAMEVTVSDTGYCIDAADQYGKVAQQQCFSGDENPGGSL